MFNAKYLVLRRDGSLPPSPVFVLGANDEAARDALAFYLRRCRELDYAPAYLAFLEGTVAEFQTPPGTPRRPDDQSELRPLHPIVRNLLNVHQHWQDSRHQAAATGGRLTETPAWTLNDAIADHFENHIEGLVKAAQTWVFARLFGLEPR